MAKTFGILLLKKKIFSVLITEIEISWQVHNFGNINPRKNIRFFEYVCFSEDVVVAEDLVAEEPAEIDGEIDSENSSSSSEEGTLCFLLRVLFSMAIRVVECSSGRFFSKN